MNETSKFGNHLDLKKLQTYHHYLVKAIYVYHYPKKNDKYIGPPEDNAVGGKKRKLNGF